MDEQATNSNCEFYNWVGDIDKGYFTYPREYGARCEKHNKFFSSKDGILEPNCFKCCEMTN